jgi:hypothetical protein
MHWNCGVLIRCLPAVLVLLVAACGGRDSSANVSTDVELDVFSGRPNPRWTISAHPADVWEAIASLPTVENQQEPGHLGYRGFVLRQGAREARVYNGRIWVREPGGARIVRDSSRLEERLIDAARARGFGALIQ